MFSFVKQRKNYNAYRISLVTNGVFSFQNNPKNIDPSYKTDLDLWDCLGRIKLVLKQFHRADLVYCRHSMEGKSVL